MLNFYQINGDGEIRTRDRLVIKALIPYQITNSTQKLKLLGEVPGYDLYYSLTRVIKVDNRGIIWFLKLSIKGAGEECFSVGFSIQIIHNFNTFLHLFSALLLWF